MTRRLQLTPSNLRAKSQANVFFLRTVLVSAGRGAGLGALQPEGLRAFRGGLGEVLRAVQALHDLLHVVVAALHRLALQRELLLHVLHHPARLFFKPLPPFREGKGGKKRRGGSKTLIADDSSRNNSPKESLATSL